MDIKRLVIANPSGNITAIVFDPTEREDMRDIGAKIQSTYPSVEQVLFVERREDMVHGQMAGGEFCGNAARALGYMLADGKDGKQTFTMSGASAPVTVNVSKGRAELTSQMALSVDLVPFEEIPVPVVHLEGISHAIMLPDHPLFNFLKRTAARPDRWMAVTHVLEDLGIKNRPASGLVFVDKNEGRISITPYVYVNAINTLYPEMACASGSIAAFIAANGGASNLSIRQPSKENLDVGMKAINGHSEIKVAGSMSVMWDGPAADLQYSAAALLGRHGVGITYSSQNVLRAG